MSAPMCLVPSSKIVELANKITQKYPEACQRDSFNAEKCAEWVGKYNSINGKNPDYLPSLSKLVNAVEQWRNKDGKSFLSVPVSVTYTHSGKQQTYSIIGDRIFNKKGEEVFSKDRRSSKKHRERIFSILKGDSTNKNNTSQSIDSDSITAQLIEHLRPMWQAMGLQIYDKAGIEAFLKNNPDAINRIQQAAERKEMADIKAKAIADGTFMKAPNGKPTNLTERQWLQVRTKAFKKWFGDWENDPTNASKVVDENGEPLVVYHNTSNEFTKFSKFRAFVASLTGSNMFGRGFYFSNHQGNSLGNINMPVFLRVVNPSEGDMASKNDGMIHSFGNGEVWYAAKNPNQIKSATDNNGDFSTENDDIQQFTTSEGEVYGFVDKDGNMYLDETIIKPEHPIHEYTHMWDRVVAERNPELWKQGVSLMQQISLWDEIANSENYGKKWVSMGIKGDKLNDLIASEVHSRLTGREGERILNEIAAKKGNEGIIAKLRQWLTDFFRELKATFSNWTREEINNLTLDDFVNMTIRDLAYGTPFDTVEEVSEMPEEVFNGFAENESFYRQQEELRKQIDARPSSDSQLEAKFGNKDEVTVSEILDNLLSFNTPYEGFVKALKDNLGELGSLKIKLVNASHEMIGRGSAGVYDPSSNTIYINRNSAYKGKGGIVDGTILHEIVHAIVSNSLKTKERKAELEALFNEAREKILKKYGVDDYKDLPSYLKNRLYGLSNLNEFAAEFFTNSDFISELNDENTFGERSNKNSLFHRLIEWIKSLLPKGITDIYKNSAEVLEDIILNSGGQIQEDRILLDESRDNPLADMQNSNDLSTYEFYSGAADGSDTIWAAIARRLGIKVKEYTRRDWDAFSVDEKAKLDREYRETAGVMNRDPIPYGKKGDVEVRRDMKQADMADAIFAVGSIKKPGEMGKRYENKSDHELVDGGTGYAVQRGIIRGIPVYVYDQTAKQWKMWDRNSNSFVPTSEPTLTPHAATIGTRDINDNGRMAIRNILSNSVNKLRRNQQQVQQQTQQPSQNTNLPGPETKINIYSKTGENADLSNFAERPFVMQAVLYLSDGTEEVGNVRFNSVEQAFQYAKLSYSNMDRLQKAKVATHILNARTGAEAKNYGGRFWIKEFDDATWDKESSKVMKPLLIKSFKQNPQALQRLLATGNATLTHTQGKGKWDTEFPRLLMEVREELRKENTINQGNSSSNKKQTGSSNQKVSEQFKKDIDSLAGYFEGGGATIFDVLPNLSDELNSILSSHFMEFMGKKELTEEDYQKLWNAIEFYSDGEYRVPRERKPSPVSSPSPAVDVAPSTDILRRGAVDDDSEPAGSQGQSGPTANNNPQPQKPRAEKPKSPAFDSALNVKKDRKVEFYQTFTPQQIIDRGRLISDFFSDIIDENIQDIKDSLKKAAEDQRLSESKRTEAKKKLNEFRDPIKGRQLVAQHLGIPVIINKIREQIEMDRDSTSDENKKILYQNTLDYFEELFNTQASLDIEAREGIRIVGLKIDDSNTAEDEADEVDDGNDETGHTATGSDGWGFQVRYTNPFDSLSRAVRGMMYSIEKTGNGKNGTEVDDLGHTRYYSMGQIYATFLSYLAKHMENADDFMVIYKDRKSLTANKYVQGREYLRGYGGEVPQDIDQEKELFESYPEGFPVFPILEEMAKVYPWVSQIIDRLTNDFLNRKDNTDSRFPSTYGSLASQFYTNFRKAYIPYGKIQLGGFGVTPLNYDMAQSYV